MMLPRGQRVLVDTNVIIEAHRVGCWNALVGHFAIETTDMCATEAGSGDPNQPGYVPVDADKLRQAVRIHKVTDVQIAQAKLRSTGLIRLDDGERELLSFGASEKGAFLLASPDGRAIRAGKQLGLLDRFVSLEELLEAVGFGFSARAYYGKKWLSRLKTDLQFENI